MNITERDAVYWKICYFQFLIRFVHFHETNFSLKDHQTGVNGKFDNC